ncbi:MAG: alpha/beta hydrolase fold protein [Myxococcaceae bacterium]|nr:alpha/beta hydrolase fold protein [Myxococcaceae bacterium]
MRPAPLPALALAALTALYARPAAAQRAAYARPDELAPEGPAHVLDFSLQARYARVLDPDRAAGLANLGGFALRTRVLLGRTVGYVGGLDGEVGGSDTGAVYGLTAHVLGAGLRWGAAGVVALHAGAGFDGVVGSVPLAARFPVQLMVACDLGPVRLQAHAGIAFVAGAPERRDGSSWLPLGDEVDAGLLVRLGRQRRYWSRTSGGGGPGLGVVYREFMGTRSVGVVLALELTGAQ